MSMVNEGPFYEEVEVKLKALGLIPEDGEAGQYVDVTQHGPDAAFVEMPSAMFRELVWLGYAARVAPVVRAAVEEQIAAVPGVASVEHGVHDVSLTESLAAMNGAQLDVALVNVDALAMPAFARRSEESRLAALKVYPRQGTLRRRVLKALWVESTVGLGLGLTREEIADKTGLSGDTVRPRVLELIKGGWVEEMPGVTRQTAGGNDAAVLRLTERACETIEREGI